MESPCFPPHVSFFLHSIHLSVLIPLIYRYSDSPLSFSSQFHITETKYPKSKPLLILSSTTATINFSLISNFQHQLNQIKKMSSTSRSWIAAASVAAVEALKDQGFCRWNYTLRSLHQQAKKKVGSYTQANRLYSSLDSSSASSDMQLKRRDGGEISTQSEESLWRIMYLSCWGPN